MRQQGALQASVQRKHTLSVCLSLVSLMHTHTQTHILATQKLIFSLSLIYLSPLSPLTTSPLSLLFLEIQLLLLLPYSSYRNKLTDEKLIRVSGIAKVEETGRSILVLKDFSLEPPHLSIEVRSLDSAGISVEI